MEKNSDVDQVQVQEALIGDPWNQERRRSERLKATTALHIMEKVEAAIRKKNLEGNLASHNTFSTLPVEEIVHNASEMGISIKHDDFATFDLLKTLELARNDMYLKQCEQSEKNRIVANESEPSHDNLLQLEWLHDESYDVEDLILVESRKKKREKRKNVRFSPSIHVKGKDQENLGQPKKRGRPCKADVLKSQKEKKKK
jgi:hypothetical protein